MKGYVYKITEKDTSTVTLLNPVPTIQHAIKLMRRTLLSYAETRTIDDIEKVEVYEVE